MKVTKNAKAADKKTTTKNAKAEKPAKAAKAAKTEKPAKGESMGACATRMVVEGKSNEEILAVLKKDHGLDEAHNHYPSWYRGAAVRKGLVTADFAKKHAHGDGWKRGGAVEDKPAKKPAKKASKKSA